MNDVFVFFTRISNDGFMIVNKCLIFKLNKGNKLFEKLKEIDA